MDLVYAAIDVGSHSVKLRIAKRTKDGWRTKLTRVAVTGLGLGNPRRDGLSADGRTRTLEVLDQYAAQIRDHEVTAVVTAGTAVLRQAGDAAAFAGEVQQRCGLHLEIISGPEEARLTYLGAVASLPPAPEPGWQLAVDIGGASTEFAWGRGHSPSDRRSLELGTITLTANHDLHRRVTGGQIATATAAVARSLAALPDLPAPQRLVGIGASPATMLALAQGRDIADGEEVHGASLSRSVLADQILRLGQRDATERRGLAGLHPGRDRVVLAGAIITAAVADRWPVAPLVVSTHGLRLGLLLDRFTAPG